MGCNALCGQGLGRSIPASQGILGEKGEKGARIHAAVELRESNSAAGTNTPREWTLFIWDRSCISPASAGQCHCRGSTVQVTLASAVVTLQARTAHGWPLLPCTTLC